MAFSMSGGPYSYNRFDAYEALTEKKKQGYNDREDESLGERDGKESSKKQSEKDRRDEAKGEAKADEKPDYIDIDKDGDKKESMKKAAKEVKENALMNGYVDMLTRLSGGVYHPLDEKKDSEPTDERKEAADRAAEEKRQKKEGKKGEAHETEELEKIEDKELAKEAFQAGWNAALAEGQGYNARLDDSLGAKHGKKSQSEKDRRDESEGMEKSKGNRKFSGDKSMDEAYVINRLIEDGLANNEVSAETIMLHMSDAWYDHLISEMGPAFPSETKAQAKAQADHREGKSSKGEKTGKNPGLKASHTSGYNRQD